MCIVALSVLLSLAGIWAMFQSCNIRKRAAQQYKLAEPMRNREIISIRSASV